MAFKGQAEYSVDSKGRVAVPAKMRNAMNPEAKGSFTMTRGIDRCIFVYPQDRWSEMESELSELNMYNRESLKFVRLIMRWADDATLDGQGRITLSRPLVEFAGLEDRALIIGAFDHIEIWNPDEFDKYLNDEQPEYETLAERVMGM